MNVLSLTVVKIHQFEIIFNPNYSELAKCLELGKRLYHFRVDTLARRYLMYHLCIDIVTENSICWVHGTAKKWNPAIFIMMPLSLGHTYLMYNLRINIVTKGSIRRVHDTAEHEILSYHDTTVIGSYLPDVQPLHWYCYRRQHLLGTWHSQTWNPVISWYHCHWVIPTWCTTSALTLLQKAASAGYMAQPNMKSCHIMIPLSLGHTYLMYNLYIDIVTETSIRRVHGTAKHEILSYHDTTVIGSYLPDVQPPHWHYYRKQHPPGTWHSPTWNPAISWLIESTSIVRWWLRNQLTRVSN